MSRPILQRVTLLGAVNAVTWVNLLLAIVAFAKDLVQASYFGTSEEADALALAFFLPDMIGNNLIGFALGVACVPVFCKLLEQREYNRYRGLSGKIFWRTMILSLAVWFLLAMFETPLLKALGPGLSPEAYELCARLYRIFLPTLLLFPLVLVASAALQAVGSYLPPAFAPVLFNAAWLAALVALISGSVPLERGATVTALAMLAGVFAMLVLVFAGLQRYKKELDVEIRVEPKDLRRVWQTFAPYLLILLCAQGVYAVERSLASTLGSGTVAGLNYAFRLSQFPNWVFVAALTTLLLPALAKASGARNLTQLGESLRRAVLATLLLTVPIALVLYVAREPIVALLFQRGAFDEHSLRLTSDMLAGYSLAIVGQALTAVGLRYFMAVEHMRAPVGIALLAVAVNIGADLAFLPTLGAAGLGYGAAVGATVQAVAMMWLVRRDLHQRRKGSESQ